MKELHTIILAAGKGTRMNSDLPKVLHPICGRPLIKYVLDIAKEIGSRKTYVVLGHKHQMVKEIMGDECVPVNQAKLLGTADAVRSVEPLAKNFKGDVLILCGDTPLLKKETIKDIIRKHRKTNAICTLLTAVVHHPDGYGRIIRGNNGSVMAIREDKDADGYERDIVEINVGVYLIKCQELFNALRMVKLNEKKKEYYLTDIIEYLSSNKMKIESIETEEATEGLGINSREDLAQAEGVIRYRILKKLMEEGVTITDPKTTYIDLNTKIGRDTVIRPFTVIENDVQIGSQCRIGPFARLRSGSRIADNVEIGNFTEVTRTKIGKHCFMKHFSYLGDSIVGPHVNIGAGTVTANFDGKEKNVTRIEEGAFIGSDSILIAPVRIGRKAVIGAGSVLTKGKSVPDGYVAKGVPAKIEPRKKG